MPPLSEPEMIEKAVNGDVHAFRWVVEKYQGFALSLSYRLVASIDDAEDIAQEAFVRLWRNLSRYRPEVKLTTWLYKIITNLCLDFLKSKHRKQRLNMESIHNNYPVQSMELADEPLLTEEFNKMISQMTEALTPKQKAVFILRDLDELSMEEVSSILSMSSNNIKSNLYYARLKMSELIKRYYHEKQS